MEQFPVHLTPENKTEFSSYNEFYWKNCIREEIYKKIISGDETDFFDYDCFARKKYLKLDMIRKLVYQIIDELKQLGWKIKTSYGDTAVFIFSTEALPRGAW
jgi:hypothetical protein